MVTLRQLETIGLSGKHHFDQTFASRLVLFAWETMMNEGSLGAWALILSVLSFAMSALSFF